MNKERNKGSIKERNRLTFFDFKKYRSLQTLMQIRGDT
jgi:hypothetical protein